MCTVLVGMQMKVHHPMTKALLSVQQERNYKKINLLKCFSFLSSVLMDSNMEALQPTKANLFFSGAFNKIHLPLGQVWAGASSLQGVSTRLLFHPQHTSPRGKLRLYVKNNIYKISKINESFF